MSVAHWSQHDRAPSSANTSQNGAPCFSANRFDASQATEAKLEVNPAAVANSGASRPGIGAIAAAAVDAGTMLLAGIVPAMQVHDDLTDSWPTPLSGAQQGPQALQNLTQSSCDLAGRLAQRGGGCSACGGRVPRAHRTEGVDLHSADVAVQALIMLLHRYLCSTALATARSCWLIKSMVWRIAGQQSRRHQQVGASACAEDRRRAAGHRDACGAGRCQRPAHRGGGPRTGSLRRESKLPAVPGDAADDAPRRAHAPTRTFRQGADRRPLCWRRGGDQCSPQHVASGRLGLAPGNAGYAVAIVSQPSPGDAGHAVAITSQPSRLIRSRDFSVSALRQHPSRSSV